jgi:hypothetical protein
MWGVLDFFHYLAAPPTQGDNRGTPFYLLYRKLYTTFYIESYIACYVTPYLVYSLT